MTIAPGCYIDHRSDAGIWRRVATGGIFGVLEGAYISHQPHQLHQPYQLHQPHQLHWPYQPHQPQWWWRASRHFFGMYECVLLRGVRVCLTVPKGATWMDVTIKDCRDKKWIRIYLYVNLSYIPFKFFHTWLIAMQM